MILHVHIDIQLMRESCIRVGRYGSAAVLHGWHLLDVSLLMGRCVVHAWVLESCAMDETVVLSFSCAMTITSSQVIHHAALASVASSSHMTRTALNLLSRMSEILIISHVAKMLEPIIMWRVHSILLDSSLWVEWNLGMLRWFWPVQCEGCSVDRDTWIIMGVLHMYWDWVRICVFIHSHLWVFIVLRDWVGKWERIAMAWCTCHMQQVREAFAVSCNSVSLISER